MGRSMGDLKQQIVEMIEDNVLIMNDEKTGYTADMILAYIFIRVEEIGRNSSSDTQFREYVTAMLRNR